VIAAFLELDYGIASVAALPTLLAGLFEELVRLHVTGTGPGVVPSAIASAADLGLAAAALPVMEAGIPADVLGSDPLAAVGRGAIEAIPGRVLGKLPVPPPFEVAVEKPLDVLKGDMVSGTASRGHMLRIREGKLKVPLQASMAHVMAALQLYRLVSGLIIIHTYDAGDTTRAVSTMSGCTTRDDDHGHSRRPTRRRLLGRKPKHIIERGAPGGRAQAVGGGHMGSSNSMGSSDRCGRFGCEALGFVVHPRWSDG